LLEAEPFSLLISDLNMPRMDGLQVLTIVRRKFPHLRTSVMTSVVDTQFRARAYAMGVDLFLEKPNSSQEIQFFMDCIESLLDRKDVEGFRGVQSKSLVDIIQLECLSQSSSTLKVTNDAISGKIWFLGGDVIDAECGEARAEEAFRRILSWKTGAFEILPAEPNRERTIFSSYQGLLLESAQALDEENAGATATAPVEEGQAPAVPDSPLSMLMRFSGVDFVIHLPLGGPQQALGVENPERVGGWAKEVAQQFRTLGERLGAGSVSLLECIGPVNNVVIACRPTGELCVGFNNSISQDLMRETMPRILEKWAS
jgi:CheY-like chemotaxis protein